MKKIIISISLLLAIAALSISLLSCSIDNNSTANSDDAQNTPAETTTVSSEPTPDPEPVIDMDELYRKVFENQSKHYTFEEAPSLEDLDRSQDPLLLYFQYFHPQQGAQILDKVWVIEGATSSFADGLLQKYSISSCNGPKGGHKFDFVSGYYHSAYLDVLFKNLTFEAVEKIPDDLIRFAIIKGDENNPDRSYSAYEDMKLYYEEDGVIYCSVQNVDSPYLHMMARAYWAKESNWDVLTAGIAVYNLNLDESKATKKVTVKESNQDITYCIYPDGKVYSEVMETSGGQCEKDMTVFVYWGETRIYFPTEELFRTVYEGKITE